MDNASFSSWHFVRLNEEFLFSEQHTLQHRARRDTHPDRMPLLRIIPDPDLDSRLPVPPKYLYCLSKTVSLIIKPEPNRPSIERVLPKLHLAQFMTSPSTNHCTISSTLGIGALKVVLDRDGQRSLRVLHKGRNADGEDFMFARRMCCVGLLLQQNGDGTFVRKGMLTYFWRHPGSDFPLLLGALRSA